MIETTFEPAGSLVSDAAVGPKSAQQVRFAVGYAKTKEAGLETVQPDPVAPSPSAEARPPSAQPGA